MKRFMENNDFTIGMYVLLLVIYICSKVFNYVIDVESVKFVLTILGVDLFINFWFKVVTPYVMRTCPKD